MKVLDYVGLALQNIARQKFRSALTIFAVVIGAMSVTIMLAIVTGAKNFVKSQFEASGVLQQVVVTQASDLDYNQARHGGGGGPSSNGVKLNDDLESKIKGVQHVKGVSASIYLDVFDSLSYKEKKLSVQNTVAIEPNGVVSHTMLAGRDLQAATTRGRSLSLSRTLTSSDLLTTTRAWWASRSCCGPTPTTRAKVPTFHSRR